MSLGKVSISYKCVIVLACLIWVTRLNTFLWVNGGFPMGMGSEDLQRGDLDQREENLFLVSEAG